MALTITKNYSDGAALTESHLDDIKSSVETFVNTTKLDNTNIQSGGISTANIADAAITAAKLATDAIETAKIADGAVTRPKLAALGQQLSSSSGNYSQTSASYTDVTNLSVSITTTGRPVWVGLISDGSVNISYLGVKATGSITNTLGFFKILQDSTTIGVTQLRLAENSAATGYEINVPSSSFNLVDAPTAGTYTYKVQAKSNTTDVTTYVQYAKLVAFEL